MPSVAGLRNNTDYDRADDSGLEADPPNSDDEDTDSDIGRDDNSDVGSDSDISDSDSNISDSVGDIGGITSFPDNMANTTKLWLPSEVSVGLRSNGTMHLLTDQKLCLRLAQANDALADIH